MHLHVFSKVLLVWWWKWQAQKEQILALPTSRVLLRDKKDFELSLLQATPEAVISLRNEMSSDTVKMLKDSYPRTLRQCQGTLGSSKRDQRKVPWDLASWLLSLKDLLDTTLRMIIKYSGVKYFKWYAGFESSLCLSIWLNKEGHSLLCRESVCGCVCTCKHSPHF